MNKQRIFWRHHNMGAWAELCAEHNLNACHQAALLRLQDHAFLYGGVPASPEAVRGVLAGYGFLPAELKALNIPSLLDRFFPLLLPEKHQRRSPEMIDERVDADKRMEQGKTGAAARWRPTGTHGGGER